MNLDAYKMELRETKAKLRTAVKAQEGYYTENLALKREIEQLQREVAELRAAQNQDTDPASEPDA